MAKRLKEFGCLLRNIEFLRTWKAVNSSGIHLPTWSHDTHNPVIRQFSSVGQTQRTVETLTSNSTALDRDDQKGEKGSSLPAAGPPSTARHIQSVDDPSFNKIDQSFENAREAYMSKTNLELLRCLVVFQMCSINVLVEKNKQVTDILISLFINMSVWKVIRSP